MNGEDTSRGRPAAGETGGRVPSPAQYDEMSADDLLAQYMKLSIQDPQNEPAQREALAELVNEIRKRGLEDELRRLESERPDERPDE